MGILRSQRAFAGIAILSLLFWFCHRADPANQALAASVTRDASEHPFTETSLGDVQQPDAEFYPIAVNVFSSFTVPHQSDTLRSIQGEARARGPVHDLIVSQVSGRNRPARTCTVTSRNNAGVGTLRDCLQNAVQDDIILFDATVFPPAAPQPILVTSQLPVITVDRLVVDASNAGVILEGSAMAQGSGLIVAGADGVVIRGLQIVHFPVDGIDLGEGTTNAIIGGDRATGVGPLGRGNLLSDNGDTGAWVHDPGTTGNRLLGNFIGTDVTGRIPRPNRRGIIVGYDATSNIIGGSTPTTRNLISGNRDAGVQFQNPVSDNWVQGNDIGVDSTGSVALGNRWGIHLMEGAHDNQIGGMTPADSNVISGNRGPSNDGCAVIIQGQGTDRNRIQGNMIGTTASGTIALGNDNGVFLDAGARANIIGGSTTQARNVISSNVDDGIHIQGPATSGNVVLGNYIGTDATGLVALANNDGIVVSHSAQNNVIGGGEAGARNLISGNREGGIWIQDHNTTGNAIQGNYIGVDKNGTSALANENGLVIQAGAQNTVVGGLTVPERNLISGNLEAGVHIANSGTSENRILGNYIGTDANGSSAIPNAIGVVILDGATENRVGGATPGARNIVSGNRDAGVVLQDGGTSRNRVMGNYIGTNVAGSQRLDNHWGVVIAEPGDDGPDDNFIGGAGAGEGNLISGNTGPGVEIQKTGTTRNQVLGNSIGTDATGTRAIGNGWGVIILLGASSNVVGGTESGARNVIGGNIMTGVHVEGADTIDNQVVGNIIGADASGQIPLRNTWGVRLQEGARLNIIGPANTIVFNSMAGIAIGDATTRRNTITRNSIHSNGGKPIDFPSAPPHPHLLCFTPILSRLSGSTCAHCIVEAFAYSGATLAGTRYLDTATADSTGNVSRILATPPPASLPYLSLTLTDVEGTTGEYHSVPICAASSRSYFVPSVSRN